MTQAIKTKTTLSANREASFGVEGLYKDTDFSMMVKREKLEELSKDKEVGAGVIDLQRILELKGLKKAEMDRVLDAMKDTMQTAALSQC